MRKRSNEKVITIQSKVLRYMRLSKGISQPVAAKAAGCSPQAIGHYENGRMEIPLARATRLVELYGFQWAEFQELLAGKSAPMIDIKDECSRLLDRIQSEEKLKAVHLILMSFVL